MFNIDLVTIASLDSCVSCNDTQINKPQQGCRSPKGKSLAGETKLLAVETKPLTP